MPYQSGSRLPRERASKLGHLEVIQSNLVNRLIESFEDPERSEYKSSAEWTKTKLDEDPLRLIFAVDGSLQVIQSTESPYKQIAFIKTALLRLDQKALEAIDTKSPHPMMLRDIMKDAALYHSTVLPLKGIQIKGEEYYDAVRKIIFQSLHDASLGGEPYKTLKWLAYEKWNDEETNSPGFGCPSCSKEISGLSYDADTGNCEHCGADLLLSDMIGFHLEFTEDSAAESVASAYMLVHETLMLFTAIRYFWDNGRFSALKKTLFLKDGPLTLRGQYSKLVRPIRRFFQYAKSKGITVHVVGQEKTGTFVDHLNLIAKSAPYPSYFIPNPDYIRKEIQRRPNSFEPYGSRTNYGNKILLKLDEYHHTVLSIPTGEYIEHALEDKMIGINRIISTLPSLISHRHEGALIPIELANGVASLSSYPSAAILRVFADIP